jgi:hypothetical protein
LIRNQFLCFCSFQCLFEDFSVLKNELKCLTMNFAVSFCIFATLKQCLTGSFSLCGLIPRHRSSKAKKPFKNIIHRKQFKINQLVFIRECLRETEDLFLVKEDGSFSWFSKTSLSQTFRSLIIGSIRPEEENRTQSKRSWKCKKSISFLL